MYFTNNNFDWSFAQVHYAYLAGQAPAALKLRPAQTQVEAEGMEVQDQLVKVVALESPTLHQEVMEWVVEVWEGPTVDLSPHQVSPLVLRSTQDKAK